MIAAIQDLVDPAELLVVAVILFNGVWNTAVGSTGGIAFATLASTLGPAVAIPVQSVVEGTSAGYRIWRLRDLIDFRFIAAFAGGGLAGGAIGFPLLHLTLSNGADELLAILVATVILAMTWLPVARRVGRSRFGPAVAGSLTTFLSLFVGGLGAPISAAVESRGVAHPVVIATSTTAIYLQYLFRLALFGITGAILRDRLWLIIVLVVASLIGTWIGGRVLIQVDPDRARRLFRLAVTAVAVSMIVRAAW